MSVFKQRLLVLAVLAVAGMALFAPNSAFAVSTPTITEGTSSVDFDSAGTGQDVDFTVANDGDTDAVNPAITVTYNAADLTVTAADAGGTSCSIVSPTVTCNPADIASGDATTVTLTVEPVSGFRGTTDVDVDYTDDDNAVPVNDTITLTFGDEPASLYVEGAGGNQPDSDADAEEGNTLTYAVSIANDLKQDDNTGDPSGTARDVVLNAQFDSDALSYDSATGATCAVDADDDSLLVCQVADVAGNTNHPVTLHFNVLEGNYDGSGIDANFAVDTSSVNTSTADSVDDTTTIVDTTPTCDGDGEDGFYSYLSLKTVAETRTAGTQSVTFTCDSEATLGGTTVVTDPNEGVSSPHSGTLSDDGTDGSLTWTPNPTLLASGKGFSDSYAFDVAADTTSPITTRVFVTFVVQPQTDLQVTLATTSPLVVPAAGATTTVTATLKNAGPDVHEGAGIAWTVPANATFVSAKSTDGSACGDFGKTEAGLQLWACGAGDLAGGASTQLTITLSYRAGTNGLTLPGTSKVSAFAGIAQSGGPESPHDATLANNTADTTIQLSAPSVVVVDPKEPMKIVGGSENKTYIGGAGNDTFLGGTGSETFIGGAGNDKANGGAGNDKLSGGTGNDTMFGASGNDALAGGTGNDKLGGGIGNDKVDGGSGNDTITCGSGTDKAAGGTGNDKIGCKDGKGGDVINGGPGKDKCYGDKNDRFLSCEKITRI